MYKIQNEFSKKGKELTSNIDYMIELSQEAGMASVFASVVFMLDEKYSEQEIRKEIDGLIDTLSMHGIEHYIECKTKLRGSKNE